MTPDEWFASTDPAALLAGVLSRWGPRRARLFLVACCRRHYDVLPTDACRDAVTAAERFADGRATGAGLDAALRGAAAADYVPRAEWERHLQTAAVLCCQPDLGIQTVLYTASYTVQIAADRIAADLPGQPVSLQFRLSVEETAQAHLVRCLTRPPGHAAPFDSGWRTSSAVGLADAIYAGRTFCDLPILADALEDAGCDDAAALGHLRGGGGHARGCWVVDLVRGRDLSA